MAKGKYEAELEQIAAAEDWELTYLANLTAAVDQIAKTMKDVAGWTGWTGKSADSASDAFVAQSGKFLDFASQLDDVSKWVSRANTARAHAADQLGKLPDATVPEWVHVAAAAAGSVVIPIPGIGAFVGNQAVEQVQNYLQAQREAAAQQALTHLQSSLSDPAPPVTFAGINPTPTPTPTPTPSGGGSGTLGAGRHVSTAGGLSASSSPSVEPGGKDAFGSQPGGLVGDGPIDGTDPGSLSGLSGGNSGLGTGPEVGQGGGVLGGLAASGASLVALSAGSRLSAGGLGGLGGVGRLGGLGAAETPGASSGGLLGSGKAGAGSAAAESEGGTGAARPSSGIMGSGGAQGGKDREKGRGLGGYIAPKLEDDEEFAPRSAGAFAGSRDDATNSPE
jgi:hypothetical protein